MSETPLDNEAAWEAEAEAVIEDVKNCVRSIRVSSLKPSNCKRIYLEVETLEGARLTMELSANGFRVLDDQHVDEDDDDAFFETPQALLGHVSPKFRNAFAERLAEKLKVLV